MIHVVHIVLSLEPGGLERLVVDWTNARNRQHPGSTSIICLDKPGLLAGQVEGDCICCVNARRSSWPFDRSAVQRIREEFNATSHIPHPSSALLHAHNLAAWQYAVLASYGTANRVIYTQHGNNPHVNGIINRWRIKWCARHTAAMIAVAPTVARYMESHQGFTPGQVRIVPNGIAVPEPAGPEARLLARQQLGMPDGSFVLGSVGRLSHEKGHDRLIRSFAQMINHPYCNERGCRLVIIGDGPERSRLESLSRSLMPEGACIFTGYIEDVHPMLAALDLFVLPSRSEGLSLALLEAMVSGLPVMVTCAGESATVVDEGRAGLILPDDDGQWSGIIADTMAADHSGMIRAAVSRVKEMYSIERTLCAYESIYAIAGSA